MADMIKTELIGFGSIAYRFTQAKPGGREVVERMVMRMAMLVMEASVKTKLSGQVLKRQTGTLARSVAQSVRVYREGDAVFGTVGTADLTGAGGRKPMAYGAAHEWGGTYTQQVAEHMRTVKRIFGRPLAAPVQQAVRAHPRTVTLLERSFLRSALTDKVVDGAIESEERRALDELEALL